MNKRIQELAEQAFRDTVLSGGKRGDKEFDQLYNERFAELIVRECIEQCADNGSNDEWDKGVRWASNQIKEHFGVEE